MPRDRFSLAQPHTLVPLHVIEQPNQCADTAGSPNNTAVQANGHHARPTFFPQLVQPVESIAAIDEEIIASGEVTTALQATVIIVEGMG